MTAVPLATRLSTDEDEALRRLHFFERHGMELSAEMRVLKAELRARDLREQVRDPQLLVSYAPEARAAAD